MIGNNLGHLRRGPQLLSPLHDGEHSTNATHSAHNQEQGSDPVVSTESHIVWLSWKFPLKRVDISEEIDKLNMLVLVCSQREDSMLLM